jgi:hypothetical protein
MKFKLILFFILSATSVRSQPVTGSTEKAIIYPSVTLQNPISPGTFGTIILAGVVQEKTRLANKPDGYADLYVGLGKPGKFIGGGVTVNIYGLTNSIGEPQNLGQGSLNFHINRLLLSGKLLLDMGVDNAVSFGSPTGSYDYITYKRSVYFSANYLLSMKEETTEPFSYLSVTVGAGNGYFKQDKSSKQNSNNSFDPYLSLATPVVKTTNFIGEWNGYDVGLGLSSIPFQKLPVMLRAETTDLIYGKPRYVFSISLPFIWKENSGSELRPMALKTIRPARTI